jgi:small subunit ribosomal protein S6
MKRNYEIYIIIDGNLEDLSIDEIIHKYENLLKKNDVEIKNTDKIGRRRLAYPIKKRLNGYYVCFEVLAPVNYLLKLERTFVLDESILRYLNVSMSKKELSEKDDYLKKKIFQQQKLEQELKESTPEIKESSEPVTTSDVIKDGQETITEEK